MKVSLERFVYEVLVSESEEDFKEKIKKYPKEFGIVKLNYEFSFFLCENSLFYYNPTK
jgi:hypothetical protein